MQIADERTRRNPCGRIGRRRPLAGTVAWLALSLILSLGALARGGQRPPEFRAGIDLVNIGVTVTDKKGHLVTDLTAADFEVLEDGKRQVVRYFAAGDGNGPGPVLHLGLLFDVSESMDTEMAFVKTAAIRFLNTLIDAADITMVDFDSQVRASRYTQDEFPRLVERIRLKKASGSTALYDAMGLYLDGASQQEGRKIVILYSDGADTRSAMRFGELLGLLKVSDVTAYAVGAVERGGPPVLGQGRTILRQIADTTGGVAFFPRSVEELDRVYRQIVAEIRAQYTLGYLSTNDRRDGTWRAVQVSLVGRDGDDYRLRSRRGYFARYAAAH